MCPGGSHSIAWSCMYWLVLPQPLRLLHHRLHYATSYQVSVIKSPTLKVALLKVHYLVTYSLYMTLRSNGSPCNANGGINLNFLFFYINKYLFEL